MGRFIARRLLASIPVLFLVSLITFGLLWLVPGDSASVFLDASATAEALDRVRRELGLDRPFLLRMGEWYVRLLQGDLGTSLLLNRSVTSAIFERLPVTLSLTFLAFIFAVLIGVAAGVMAAVHHGKAADQGMMTLALLGLSIPEFWLGLVLIWLVAVLLPIFPAGDYVAFAQNPWQWARHIALPTFTLACVQMGFVARMTRSSMLEVLGQDFVRTARAKGLSKRATVWGHVLRNAMIPVITVMGLQFANLLTGTVVIENVFSLPGLGRLVFQAIANRVLIVVRNVVMLLAAAVIVINFIVDVLYVVIDPRLKVHAA